MIELIKKKLKSFFYFYTLLKKVVNASSKKDLDNGRPSNSNEEGKTCFLKKECPT